MVLCPVGINIFREKIRAFISRFPLSAIKFQYAFCKRWELFFHLN